MTRPQTYGSAADARRYVAAILAAPAPPPGAPAYIAMPPELPVMRRWPEVHTALCAALPGVPLATWSDLPPGIRAELAEVTRAERVAWLAGHCRGLVVVALRTVTRRTIGPGALAEVGAFTAARRPVLVWSGRRLTAWPDCRARPTDHLGRRVAAYLDVPAATSRPLPTLAASLRALGTETMPAQQEHGHAHHG